MVLEATVPSPSVNKPSVEPPLETIGTFAPIPVRFSPMLPIPFLVMEVTEAALVSGPIKVAVMYGLITLRVSAPELSVGVMLPLITSEELFAPMSLSNTMVVPSNTVGFPIVRVWPLSTSKRVPSAIVKVPVPTGLVSSGVKPFPAANSEAALLLFAITSPPPLTRTAPPNTFAPPNCSRPSPVFSIEAPVPARIADSVSDDAVSE